MRSACWMPPRTFYGYSADTMLKSEKGWMVMVRTYPRHPFWEETNESKPHVDAVGPARRTTGSSRKPSNTARTSSCTAKARRRRRICRTRSSPRIPTSGRMTTGFRSRRSTMTTRRCGIIKLPWQEIKRHSNPLWEKGYQFYCVTPEDPAPGAQPVVGERLGADLREQLRRSVPDGQADAGGRASTSCTSTRRRPRTGASTTATTSMWTATRWTGRIAAGSPRIRTTRWRG